MIRRRTRQLAIAAAVAATVLPAVWMPASGAQGPCVFLGNLERSIARAEIVVVGTVTATRSSSRVATVEVDEVWKGEVAAAIEIHGGPDEDDSVGIRDRTFATGVRYLFFAGNPVGGGIPGSGRARYVDDICSDTQEWREGLALSRPVTARMIRAPVAVAPPVPNGEGPPLSQFLIMVGVLWFVAFKFIAGVTPVAGESDYSAAVGRIAGVWWKVGLGSVVVGCLMVLRQWLAG